MSLKLGYTKVFFPLLFERKRRINPNYNRRGNKQLQAQTTNIYLSTDVYEGPPWSQAGFSRPGLPRCSRQRKALPSQGLPSRAIVEKWER